MNNRLRNAWAALLKPLQNEWGVFNIANGALGASVATGYWDGQPTYRTQFTDNALVATATFAGCTSAFSTGFPVRAVRAVIWLKNYRLIAATNIGDVPGFKVQLQVAEGVAGFSAYATTTNTGVIDMREFPRATSCMTLSGFVPETGVNYSAARIVCFPQFTFGAATPMQDAASFDCNIDAVPG